MPILSKKILSTLAGISAITLTASSVISCGFNINRIIDRRFAEDVFNTTFSSAVTSWNTAFTMQAEDQTVLANTHASLVALDPYGRLYGDVFKSNSDLSKNQVGETEDNITWTYQMREGLKWINADGTSPGTIKPTDLLKTAWFALYSSVTNSSVGSLWRSFIAGAEDVTAALNEGRFTTYQSFEDAYFNRTSSENRELFDNFGLIVNQNDYQVQFVLTKPAPYFESLLAYSAFSPIFTTGTDQVTNFENGVYSGAFIPISVTSSRIRLRRNENYHFASEMTIREINYISTSGGGANVSRTLFEAGNTSGFVLGSADTMGWHRYIGSDWKNPVFDQVYSVPSARQTSTFVFYFNTFNGALRRNPNNEQFIGASKMLQNRDVRAFLATSLNRSHFARFFSRQFDSTDTSSMVRNTYVSPTVGIDEKGIDYTEHLANHARKVLGSDDENLLLDGTDFLLDRSEELGVGTRCELIQRINEYIELEGIQRNSRNGDRVVLQYLANPSLNTTLNPFLTIMVKSFNEIENNPIQIEIIRPASAADFSADAQAGNFDIYSSGWGPDFADPATFLATIRLGGDLRNFTGTARFFNNDGELSNENVRSSSTDDYIAALEEYTSEFERIDVNVTDVLSERFKKFAEIEYNFMYRDFLFMPVMSAAPPRSFNVSHVHPHSITYTTTYGTSSYRSFTTRINSRLLTAEELKQVFADYAEKIARIAEDQSFGKKDHAFWR